jgi:hypothetical protein
LYFGAGVASSAAAGRTAVASGVVAISSRNSRRSICPPETSEPIVLPFTAREVTVADPKQPRIRSIDLLRGADVLLMLFVNEVAGVAGAPAFLKHMGAAATTA